MEITRDRTNRTTKISQEAYLRQVLKRFGMENCKAVSTPMVENLTKAEDGQPDKEYMSLVGSLMWAAIISRPDLMQAVNQLCRHLTSSGPEHMAAAKHLLRYIFGTLPLGLVFKPDKYGLQLVGYVDADWGGCKDTRRSTSAYVFKLVGATISWSTKRQATVATSSAEAELQAASWATKEAIWLARLLTSMGVPQPSPVVLYEDNQSCIALSKDAVQHKRTKHVDIQHFFVRECVERRLVKLYYVPTEHQLADMLTKPVGRERLLQLRPQVMGADVADVTVS
jgi:hypothetical protein